MKLGIWRGMGEPRIDARMRALVKEIDDKKGPSLLQAYFEKANVGINANEAMYLQGSTINQEFAAPADCVVKSITVLGNASRTAGSLTVTPTVNGTALSEGTSLNATDVRVSSKVYEPTAQHAVAQGERVGVLLTSDGTWAPTTLDITVLVVLEVSGDY